jgi:hypothetical protein
MSYDQSGYTDSLFKFNHLSRLSGEGVTGEERGDVATGCFGWRPNPVSNETQLRRESPKTSIEKQRKKRPLY